MVKRAGPSRTRWGGPDKTNEIRFSIASRAYEGLSRPPQRICERCGRRPGELLVVGEREGLAVWICRSCREPGGFSRILARRRGRYRL